MITIHIEDSASQEAVDRVRAHLDEVVLRDINFNGAEFEIERDDFTWIDAEGYDAAALLNNVQRILSAE